MDHICLRIPFFLILIFIIPFFAPFSYLFSKRKTAVKEKTPSQLFSKVLPSLVIIKITTKLFLPFPIFDRLSDITEEIPAKKQQEIEDRK